MSNKLEVVEEPNKRCKKKVCVVCKDDSFKNKNKIFVNIPRDPETRKKWIVAIENGVNKAVALKVIDYVCEDHFNVSTFF